MNINSNYRFTILSGPFDVHARTADIGYILDQELIRIINYRYEIRLSF